MLLTKFMFFLFYKYFKFVAHGCWCGVEDGMVVLVIIWMTLMDIHHGCWCGVKDEMVVSVIVWMTLIDNHHAIESKARNCYYLVENDKCDPIMGLEKLKMMK